MVVVKGRRESQSIQKKQHKAIECSRGCIYGRGDVSTSSRGVFGLKR
jgi:hypothetical protein